MRTLTSVLGNSQRLDGGALFGNAPRALWQTWIAPDDDNRIPLACRCLVVRDAGRTLLFEAGIGAFFEPALRERYGVVEPHHVLLDSLAAIGVAPDDVDVVVVLAPPLRSRRRRADRPGCRPAAAGLRARAAPRGEARSARC